MLQTRTALDAQRHTCTVQSASLLCSVSKCRCFASLRSHCTQRQAAVSGSTLQQHSRAPQRAPGRRILTHGIEVSGPGSLKGQQDPGGQQQGQITHEVVASMKDNITQELNAERVDIVDAYGDGRHVSIDVVASAFEHVLASSFDRWCSQTLLIGLYRGQSPYDRATVVLRQGLNSVKRQRMVYKAIWLELQNTVHAVDAMTTKTPQEAGL